MSHSTAAQRRVATLKVGSILHFAAELMEKNVPFEVLRHKILSRYTNIDADTAKEVALKEIFEKVSDNAKEYRDAVLQAKAAMEKASTPYDKTGEVLRIFKEIKKKKGIEEYLPIEKSLDNILVSESLQELKKSPNKAVLKLEDIIGERYDFYIKELRQYNEEYEKKNGEPSPFAKYMPFSKIFKVLYSDYEETEWAFYQQNEFKKEINELKSAIAEKAKQKYNNLLLSKNEKILVKGLMQANENDLSYHDINRCCQETFRNIMLHSMMLYLMTTNKKTFDRNVFRMLIDRPYTGTKAGIKKTIGEAVKYNAIALYSLLPYTHSIPGWIDGEDVYLPIQAQEENVLKEAAKISTEAITNEIEQTADDIKKLLASEILKSQIAKQSSTSGTVFSSLIVSNLMDRFAGKYAKAIEKYKQKEKEKKAVVEAHYDHANNMREIS